MQKEITTVGDLKRFLAPFMEETVIIIDYAKSFYIEYVLPTNSSNAYLKLNRDDKETS